jgi:hypothetical protein
MNMRMTIHFDNDACTLSAHNVEVKDQNDARKIAGDLFAQAVKLQNGGTMEVVVKSYSGNLTKTQAIQRLADVAGVTKAKARSLLQLAGAGGAPTVFKGPSDEARELELKLRDHGIQAAVKKDLLSRR